MNKYNIFNNYTKEDLIIRLQKQTQNIAKLINIGNTISSNQDLNEILDVILEEVIYFTNSDAGSVYLLNQKTKQLDFKVVKNKTLKTNLGGKNGKIGWNSIDLYDEDGSANMKNVSVVCALSNEIINIDDVYETKEYDFSGAKVFDEMNKYRSKSMLVIPMINHEDDVIGVLQLINKLDEKTNETTLFSHNDEDILISLASQAAVSITKTMLIEDFENLLEAFLQSISIAVDEKSPYTGEHVKKVVSLTDMITQAVNNNTTIFKDKNYSQDELKQNRLAAWMHDIGKITTPEHVIDKPTKLSTIFDRIKNVELKFEIAKKDLKIDLLEKKINNDKYDKKLQTLNTALEFILQLNQGKEFVRDEDLVQLEEISKLTFKYNESITDILNEDEIYNLGVRKGTLTKEEREIINNHINISIKILDSLPFPKKYERIPEIAGGHHEKINGKGYPNGLKGDELVFDARIMAIADIFEALTAPDRPYKEPLKLSKAMKILYFMVKDDHIDKDIMKFFYDEKLYLKFANEFMDKSQIDDVPDYFEEFEYS